MEEKKTRFVVYSDGVSFTGGYGQREILGGVNSLDEGKQLLIERWKKLHGGGCEKEIAEINSHTEEELVGKDGIVLYSGVYFHEGISRVPDFIEEESKETQTVTLGEILKRELIKVGNRKWEMEFTGKADTSYLKIEGEDKVPIVAKYENIVGLPTHHVDNYRVLEYRKDIRFSEKDFPNVDWATISVEESDKMVKDLLLKEQQYFSEDDAVRSLPDEIVLKGGSGNCSIRPYDRYGYHIAGISAYGGHSGNSGVYIHIKRDKIQ